MTPKTDTTKGGDKDKEIQSMIGCKTVAKIIGISTRTVWRLVSTKEFPAPARIGRCVRWRLTDIEGWIESHRHH